MLCENCGKTIAKLKDQWCMYQLKNGQVISQLFDPDAIPRGWYDSPGVAKAKAKAKVKVTKPELLEVG